MSLKIYNSLTRIKEEFLPLDPRRITMYVCGPTVYDLPHIGHARSAYVFDVIRRYLEFRYAQTDTTVVFVRNVTDVDDKIIEKAHAQFPSEPIEESCVKVAQEYLAAYHEALFMLNIDYKPPRVIEPKASEYIDKMCVFIQQLITRGCAYEAGGDVYFDVTKSPGYGKLSRQSLDHVEAGARVSSGELKHNPLDFALWKAAKENEPSWVSPWGKGRPGWHIECSVMSSDILGDQFDIHGGGMDLIFPHHENEIAQSESAGKPFARYWIHHGLLTINGQKMSKSLGNYITVDGFLSQWKDADILKLFFLTAHYSHPIDFTMEKMQEAAKQKKIFDELTDKVNCWGVLPHAPAVPMTVHEKEHIDRYCDEVSVAMDDDFNMPQALAKLFTLADEGARYVSADNQDAFRYIHSRMVLFLRMFGLKVKEKKEIDPHLVELVRLRDAAKKNKEYIKADVLRQEIKERFGLLVVDTRSNVTLSEA